MSNKKLKTNIFQIVFHRDDQFVERPRVFYITAHLHVITVRNGGMTSASFSNEIDLHVVTSPEN